MLQQLPKELDIDYRKELRNDGMDMGTDGVGEMIPTKGSSRRVLVIEQDPELLGMFAASFTHAGYYAVVTEKVIEAIEILVRGEMFDLVVVDISDRNHLDFVAKVQHINIGIPVLTVIDAADKSLIIELLNMKRVDFIEHFIDSYAMASYPHFGIEKPCETSIAGNL